MNIQYQIGKKFGSREIAYYIFVNAYFGPRLTNRPHAKTKHGPGKSKFEVGYYIQTYFYPKTLFHIRKKLKKQGQEVIYSSKCFNCIYMKFLDYETLEN